MTAAKMLDPVCDMIVVLAEARDQGVTLELADRQYAFAAGSRHGHLDAQQPSSP